MDGGLLVSPASCCFNQTRARYESIHRVIIMKNGMKIIAALSMAFAGMLGTSAMVNHVAATTAIECGCGKRLCDGRCRLLHRKSTCQTCDTQCGCVECPQCACEVCKLEVDNSKIKKTCFQVEQKTICVPPVRLPWKKDCPPVTSKTKTVNVLKTHSYECPNCTYKWTLQKPVVMETSDQGAAPTKEVVTAPPADSSFLVTSPGVATQNVSSPAPLPGLIYGSSTSNRR